MHSPFHKLIMKTKMFIHFSHESFLSSSTSHYVWIYALSSLFELSLFDCIYLTDWVQSLTVLFVKHGWLVISLQGH